MMTNKMIRKIRALAFLIVMFCACTLCDVKANNIFYNSNDSYDFFQNIAFPIDANAIHSIFQDTNGIVWFGTKNGLYSYNGYNFHSYRSEFDPNSNVVNCIQPTDGHTLILGTDNGLVTFDLKTKRLSEIKQSVPEVRALALINNTLWIGTYHSGLFSYDLKSETLKSHQIAGKTIPLITDLEIADGRLYVGSYNGLACCDGIAKWIKDDTGQALSVYSLCYDTHDKVLWIGTEGIGMCRYDIAAGTIKKTKINTGNVIKCIVHDRKNNLLMGTDAGLFVYNTVTQTVNHVIHDSHRQSSLCNDIIWCAFLDKESNIWIGTNRGVSLLPKEYDIYTIPLFEITPEWYGNMFTTMLKDKEGTYWLGGENGLVQLSGKKQATWFRNDNKTFPLRHNHVRKIYEDRSGNLWIASDGGVARYSKVSHQFEYFTVRHHSQSYDTKWSYDLYEDYKGRLWIASYLGGLFVVDMKKFNSKKSIVEADTVLIGCPIYQFETMDTHKLVANTQKGIVSIDIETFKVRDFHAYDDIMTVFDGKIWYSSDGKLFMMDLNGKRAEIPYDRGTAHRILSFVHDNDNLWFSSSEGMFYYSKKHNSVKKYTSAHRDLFMGYYDSWQKRIIWGGNDCLVYQRTNRHINNKYKANKILVTSILSNGAELAEGSDFSFKETHNGGEIRLFSRTSITLELSNFIYTLNGNREFYYNIDDEKEWVKIPNDQNQLTLAGLSGGKHIVKISNCNPQIEKQAQLSSFMIMVPYPWYATKVAWIVYVFILILATYLVVSYLQKRNQRKYEQKERERFLELSSLKMDFFVNISHELKTPLSLVIAPLGKLMSEVKEAKLKSSLERINTNALRLSALINKILDFNKLEYESEDTLILSKVNICQVIKNSIKNFSTICEQRNIKIAFNANVQQLVMNVDVLKIESVINNLLSNAVKYIDKPNGMIEINLLSNKNDVVMNIHDNGPGINEKDLPYVFIRYFQSSTAAKNGSGIGLYLVKKFIELHGGTVSAQNDNGLTVTISLPLDHAESDSAAIEAIANVSEQPGEEGKKKILIIDDNEEIVDFLSESLSDDYTCIKAHDGDEGLRATEQHIPDLVIVDQMMPRVSGMEYVRNVRHNLPTANIPIIMLTAKDDYCVEVESIKSGVDVFMSKPFDMKKLYLHIVRLLKKQETLEKFKRVEQIASPVFSDVENASNPDELLLEKITNCIEKNMAKEGFNIESLSEEVGVSQKQLYRKMKQLTGMTPINYLRKLRMKKAHALLQSQPNFSITEVLYMIGISNASYFNKCFVEEFGITPKELIKQAKEERKRQG